MRVLISAQGDHEPAGQHYMVVDNHGLLLDLSKVTGTLHDPTIARVEWGPSVISGHPQEAGMIVRTGSPPQGFHDRDLLKPYLDAWRAQKARLLPGESAQAPS